MLIAFVHTGKAFLPGMEAYSGYFSKRGIEATILLKKNLKNRKPDIEWHFMGTHLKKAYHSSVIIHEYASASIPPFADLKNAIKRKLNIKPDFRVFLNEYVKEKFQFTDSIPFGYRDLGLNSEFLNAPVELPAIKKEYDFIYCGSTTADLQLDKVLDHFSRTFKDKSMLILSKNFADLAAKYKMQKNIQFAGPVTQSQVPGYITRARFAINFKPDIEPHNRQTVTKLMEYAACKVPVITSDFAWVRQFHQQYGGEYFYLKEDLSNFTWENINQFQYAFPDLSGLTWEDQIKRSGILDFLSLKFPQINWY
jgi:glycosyltransferase involved in cell wall biosynthesis